MGTDIRVYRMNDCEWWASKWDIDKTLEFYLRLTGVTEEENPLDEMIECDLDNDGMWMETNNEEDLEKLGENDEVISVKQTNIEGILTKSNPGDIERRGECIFKFITFREAIQQDKDFKEPYCIASTEY